jgi:hypothetical protein
VRRFLGSLILPLGVLAFALLLIGSRELEKKAFGDDWRIQ